MKSPKPYLAVAACLAAGLTACATTTPQHTGTAALTTVHAPGRPAHTPAGCPLGRPVPPGITAIGDYADFLQLGRTFYLAGPEPIKASQLGSVIAHVRCSLTAELSTAYVTAESDNTARTTFGWTRSDSRSPGPMASL